MKLKLDPGSRSCMHEARKRVPGSQMTVQTSTWTDLPSKKDSSLS